VTLLVTVFIVIWDVLILILEGAPRIEIIPEVVKVLDLFSGAVFIAKPRNGLDLGKTGLCLEDQAP
jgi:hypothetical protein